MNEPSADEFLRACGASDGFSISVTNQETGRQFRKEFTQPFAVIGRNREADLGLFDARISWRHAYLQMIEGRLLCLDLHSRTGVCWGDRAQHSGWIDPAVGIRVGPFVLRPEGVAPGEAPVGDSSRALGQNADIEALPPITLEFGSALIRHRGYNRTWRLDRMLTLVGQAAECKVRFADPSVSTFHSSLIRTPGGLWVVDLYSRNGTLLNGGRVRWAPLGNRDELQIGSFLIRVHLGVVGRDGWSRSAPDNVPDSGAALAQGPRRRTTELDSNHKPLPPSIRPPTPTEPLMSDLPLGTLVPAEDVGMLHPPAVDQSEMLRGVLGPIFHQFAMMQQGMFEQFQQTLMMVVQTLNAQQKSHLDLVREELDQMRSLNKEMMSLQKELVALNKSAKKKAGPRAGHKKAALNGKSPAASDSPSSPNVPTPENGRAANGKATVHSATRVPVAPDAKPTVSEPAPASVEAPTDSSSADDAFEVSLSDLLPPSPPETAATKPKAAGSFSTASAGANLPAEVHGLIIGRLRAIQEERQSLWQKILKKLTG